MHDGQVSVDITTVRRLIAAQFPHLQHLPVERVPSSGTVSTIFRLGTELSIRFPLLGTDPEEVELTLQKEAGAMQEFAEFCPLQPPDRWQSENLPTVIPCPGPCKHGFQET